MSAGEARCERTDLLQSMCAHCLGHKDTTSPSRLSQAEVLSWFTARFDGICDNCGKRFDAGDTIAFIIDGSGYACSECLA